LVNTSQQEKYIRNVLLSVEIERVRTNFELQPDLRAMDLQNKPYEYALEGHDLYDKETPLPQLLPNRAVRRLGPQEAIEGWLRFMAADVNPDRINSNTWQVTVIDSLGTEYPITHISDTGKAGPIGLRRI